MTDPSESLLELRILGALCTFVFCGILVAGLWPFHYPSNEVTWLKNAAGLRFGRHGTVVSSGRFKTPSSQDDVACSLEIWLLPRFVDYSSTVLAFYTPDNMMRFSLHQSDADLALQGGLKNEHVQTEDAGIVFVDDIFRQRKPLFISIASGLQGTRIYVNGALTRTAPQFRLSTSDFAGQLVLGTSPAVNDSWSGLLRGLAVYKQELTAAQVSRHFETWAKQGRPELGQNEQVLALYLFDEHHGRTIHDHTSSGVDLYIPERYLILHEKFLEPPWKEFRMGWSYWQNIAINIGGFIPLGFFFCAYLTAERQLSRPALVTIILGAAVSITIEVLQAYLPTRDSGMTDIITNTLGTVLGVTLYRWKAAFLTASLHRIRSAFR